MSAALSRDKVEPFLPPGALRAARAADKSERAGLQMLARNLGERT